MKSGAESRNRNSKKKISEVNMKEMYKESSTVCGKKIKKGKEKSCIKSRCRNSKNRKRHSNNKKKPEPKPIGFEQFQERCHAKQQQEEEVREETQRIWARIDAS